MSCLPAAPEHWGRKRQRAAGVPIDGLAVLARGGLVAGLGDVVLLHVVEAAKIVVLDLAQLEEVAARRRPCAS